MEKRENIYLEIVSKESSKIEEKFSNGESLSPDDIHTLAIKSQYKHIDRLDGTLTKLENQFNGVEKQLEEKKGEIILKSQKLIEKFDGLKASLQEEGDRRIVEIKGENEKRFRDIDKTLSEFKVDINRRYGDIETRLAQLEVVIEKSQKNIGRDLTNTVRWYIAGTGLILIIMKSLDIFLK
jgi:uncharacterized coiled-coil DUF342 family protein